MGEWIRVEKRLPYYPCCSVWCWGTYDGRNEPAGFEGIYHNGKWYCLNNGDYVDGGYGRDYEAVVSHWQELPEEPE